MHFFTQSGKIYTWQRFFTQAPPVVPVTNMRYAYCIGKCMKKEHFFWGTGHLYLHFESFFQLESKWERWKNEKIFDKKFCEWKYYVHQECHQVGLGRHNMIESQIICVYSLANSLKMIWNLCLIFCWSIEGRRRESCKAGISVRWDKVDSVRDLGGLKQIFRQGGQRRRKGNIKKRRRKKTKADGVTT